MPYTPGQRLGHYEILSLLGKGGMGEVYRAHDPRLKRDVAIKVSLEKFNERFDREAKVIAQLNHPNICGIYDVGPDYLVMELVEGETLAERIQKGPLPENEALEIAAQIGEALEAAHDKGVVHRDLKPANVKITPEGRVKVLDFGLAKHAVAVPAPGDDSPTLTMGMTEVGMIMGTAAYMAPEQAKGKAVDKRADIWAYGVVLYEMLTGKRPFVGETISDVLALVITQEPDLAQLPEKSRRLVAACLTKDPKKRLRDVGESWRMLEAASVGTAGRGSAGRIWGLVTALATGLALLGFLHFRETPPAVQMFNTSLLPPEGTVFDLNTTLKPALSPDGTRIVFGARSSDGKVQLYLRPLDSPTAQILPGTERASLPFWSPDSRWVGFGADNKLKKIDITGGPPVTITDVPGNFRGGSWSQQGVIVFAQNLLGGPLMRVAAGGGMATPATLPDKSKATRGDRLPFFLPDGRHFLYVDFQERALIRVGSLDEPGKTGKVVADVSSQAVYAEGHLLYTRDNTLMAQPFDLASLATTGEARPLAERIPLLLTPPVVATFAVSNGLLAYQAGLGALESKLEWRDRSGKLLGTLRNPGKSVNNVELSPDRRLLAASIYGESGNNSDLWVYDVARDLPTRFTFDPALDRNPIWSPDGTALSWSRNSNGTRVMRKASSGAGAEEILLSGLLTSANSSWSLDGKSILYETESNGGTTRLDLWVLPLVPGEPGAKPQPRVLLQTPFNERWGQFSPDGNWVAYESDESGLSEIYVMPFVGSGGKRQISSGGGTYPRWRQDGKELFYATSEGQLKATEISLGKGTMEVGRTQTLFDGIISISGRGYTYDVSRDGQKFLVIEEGSTNSLPITLVQNWPLLLKR